MSREITLLICCCSFTVQLAGLGWRENATVFFNCNLGHPLGYAGWLACVNLRAEWSEIQIYWQVKQFLEMNFICIFSYLLGDSVQTSHVSACLPDCVKFAFLRPKVKSYTGKDRIMTEKIMRRKGQFQPGQIWCRCPYLHLHHCKAQNCLCPCEMYQ